MEDSRRPEYDIALLLQFELDAMMASRQAASSTELPAARALFEGALLVHQTRLERLAAIAREEHLTVPDLFSAGRGFATPGFVCAALRGTGPALRALRIDERIGQDLWAAARKWSPVSPAFARLAAAAAKEQRDLVAALDAEIATRIWEQEAPHYGSDR